MIPLGFSSKGQSDGKFYGADGTTASGTKRTATVRHSHKSESEGAVQGVHAGHESSGHATYYCANCPYASGTYAVPDGSDRHFCSCADG